MKTPIQLPVLKASAEKLFDILVAVYNHPFDRDGLREDVLKLYKSNYEKSVLRGMVIPTLRHLGMIIGYNDIRLSTNGRLLTFANSNSAEDGKRVLRAILLELDQTSANIISVLSKQELNNIGVFEQNQSAQIDAPSPKQALERVKDWISYFVYSRMVDNQNNYLKINADLLKNALEDVDAFRKAYFFKDILFKEYLKIVLSQHGMRSIDIEDLRQNVAISSYQKYSDIITGNQFDSLLSKVPQITSEYTITYGRSMGAEEKLFFLNGKYFESISIQMN